MRFPLLFTFLLLLGLAAKPVSAQDGAQEFPAWTRDLEGTIGPHRIALSLSREADTLSGSYCYGDCKAGRISLAGIVENGEMRLEERAAPDAPVTGRWVLRSGMGPLSGEWRGPKGGKALPVVLGTAGAAHDFPFDIRVRATGAPGAPESCNDVPAITAILLRGPDGATQELGTDSQGTCGMFLPEVVDVNFDGWPDLVIALFLPAAPNIPQQYWIYDPVTGRMADAPAALQEITSPEFIPEEKRIVSTWRAGCCDHGIDVYQWKGAGLEKVDSGESYFMPVRLKGEIVYCYVMPGYGHGRIDYAPAPVEADGRLSLDLEGSDCDVSPGAFIDRIRIDVYGPEAQGSPLLRTARTRWAAVDMPEGRRWCPEIPVYDGGRIDREVLRDEACLQKDPTAPAAAR
ncbi:hypothetical protein [Inquilinus sp. Marseille-Q2685]|uniref:XAC2610-related protein n=1 Tax=Inquilinus sp. Marseille-Q2685 TaxID=2866581 RepID=UPI001CE47FF1|nr:hypothetical protein [Inquilinus sp. Marseille-Q2685]